MAQLLEDKDECVHAAEGWAPSTADWGQTQTPGPSALLSGQVLELSSETAPVNTAAMLELQLPVWQTCSSTQWLFFGLIKPRFQKH